MDLTMMNLEDIKPYPQNARINDDTVAKVKASILEFGYNVPITVDKYNVIVTGHTRHLALQELKIKEVGVVVLRDLSEKLIGEYRIMDNKIQELSEWDEEKLVLELRQFQDLDSVAENFGAKIENSVEESFGSSIKPVTKEQIELKAGQQEEHFKNLSDKKNDRIVDCKCGKCGEEFGIRAQDLGL